MPVVLLLLFFVLIPFNASARVAPGQLYLELANEDKGFLQDASEGIYGDDNSDGGMTSSIYLAYMYPLSSQEIVTFYIDQAAFTPSGENKRELTVQEGDRPFSSYMSIGGSYKVALGPTINTVGLRLLGTGDYGMGEVILNSLHDFAGKDTYDGWQDEVEDKVGGVIEYRGVSRQFGACVLVCSELNPHVAFDVGNIVNKAATGATFRFGNRLPEDFGPSDFSLFSRGTQYITSPGLAWEVFAGVEARYVFSNYLIEGETKITGDSIVDMNNLQADFQTGVNVSFISRSFRANTSLTFINRSAEFVGQSTQQFLRFGIGMQF